MLAHTHTCVCVCRHLLTPVPREQGNPKLPPSVAESVVDDNLVFLHHMHMFGPELCNFVMQFAPAYAATLATQDAATIAVSGAHTCPSPALFVR